MCILSADYHIHTKYSFDCGANPREVCLTAVQKGLTHIAITDHVEMWAYKAEGHDRTLDASFRKATGLKNEFKDRLYVARGVELGEPLQDRYESELVLAKYNFDFVLCSLHNIYGEADFYYLDYNDISDDEYYLLIERHLNETLEMAQWGRFNALAHIDYAFKYINADRRPSYERWQNLFDQILRTLAEKDIALEINVSGLRNTLRRTLPAPELVKRFRQFGGKHVTVGSDAHFIKDIGAGIDEGAAIAKQAGFNHVTVFESGQPVLIEI